MGISTNIDVTLANGAAYRRIVDWKVAQQLSVSDHNLIYLSL